jgi:hypothetical protein
MMETFFIPVVLSKEEITFLSQSSDNGQPLSFKNFTNQNINLFSFLTGKDGAGIDTIKQVYNIKAFL